MINEVPTTRVAKLPHSNVGPVLTIITLCALFALMTWQGWRFYLTPLEQRFGHPGYDLLSPSGFLGHGYGFVGTALIMTNLLYVVRRKLASWPLGPMRLWLDLHVLTGLSGSLMILFHSAFQLRNLLATITAVALLLVVLSGLIGRYLVSLQPRADPQLRADFLMWLKREIPEAFERIQRGLQANPVTVVDKSMSVAGTLLRVPLWLREARRRRLAVRRAFAQTPVPSQFIGWFADDYRRVQQELADLVSLDARAYAASMVLRGWRNIHRFFAIVMVVSVVVHIGVAWYYGYRWIWEDA